MLEVTERKIEIYVHVEIKILTPFDQTCSKTGEMISCRG